MPKRFHNLQCSNERSVAAVRDEAQVTWNNDVNSDKLQVCTTLDESALSFTGDHVSYEVSFICALD